MTGNKKLPFSRKRQSSRKLDFLSLVPATFSGLLLRKHRTAPIWSRKTYFCAIKSSFLTWRALEDDALKIKSSSFSVNETESIEELMDLRNSHVLVQPATKKGFPFTVVPASGKGRPVTFMAASEELRSQFVFYIMKSSSTVSLSDFKILSVIGKGFFGTILVGYKKSDPEKKLYALKEIKMSILRNRSRVATVQGERIILQKVIGNPFLVGLEYAFANANALYLVMEFMQGGDFLNYMKANSGRLPKNSVQFYGAELLLALQHLHSMDIVHRDLKPENILLDKEGHLRLTDMGLSKQLRKHGVAHTFCGTDAYLAPEMLDIDNKRRHGKPVDFWQYGSLIYEMFVGRPPFYKRNINRHDIHEAIIDNEVDIPSYVPEDAADLIRMLLQKDPSKRLADWEVVKRHPFFSAIDWAGVSTKKVSPPVDFKTGDDYLKNFDENLTSIPLRLDPAPASTADDFFGFDFTRLSSFADKSSSLFKQRSIPSIGDKSMSSLSMRHSGKQLVLSATS